MRALISRTWAEPSEKSSGTIFAAVSRCHERSFPRSPKPDGGRFCTHTDDADHESSTGHDCILDTSILPDTVFQTNTPDMLPPWRISPGTPPSSVTPAEFPPPVFPRPESPGAQVRSEVNRHYPLLSCFGEYLATRPSVNHKMFVGPQGITVSQYRAEGNADAPWT